MTMPQKLGKYEVRREIGQGGMGVVYEGYDPLIERRVALKVVRSAQVVRGLPVVLKVAMVRRQRKPRRPNKVGASESLQAAGGVILSAVFCCAEVGLAPLRLGRYASAHDDP